MLVLPGPGLLTILIGLTILSVDLSAARKLRQRALDKFTVMKDQARRKIEQRRRSKIEKKAKIKDKT